MSTFQDSVFSSSSHISQDEIRNSTNSVSLKQKALGLKLVCNIPLQLEAGRRAACSVSVFIIIWCYFMLMAVGVIWAQRIEHNNNVYFLFALCYTVMVAVFIFILSIGQIVLFLFQNVIKQKVKVVDSYEEDVKIGAPTWLLCLLGCCLFPLLAAIMGWQTNNYLEKGIIKYPGTHSESALLLPIYASPYCFGLVILIILALVSLYVMITHCCARILANTLNISVNVSTTLDDIKMSGIKLFCTSPIGCRGSTICDYSQFVILMVVFCSCLLLTGWDWVEWRIRDHDVFHLFILCVTLVGAIVSFILMVEQIILWLFQNVIQQKVKALVDGEDILMFGLPGFFFSFFGCFLFPFLASIMGLKTNNYLEKGISIKHPHPDLLLILYCFGLVSSIALALVSFCVFTTMCCARIRANTLNIPVNVATTLNAAADMHALSEPAQSV